MSAAPRLTSPRRLYFHRHMVQAVRNIVIVGGGTAGWLTAGVIAAKHRGRMGAGFSVTLVESPNTPIIGVGEGTWPTLRSTLARIGVSETEFFRRVRRGVQAGRPVRALDHRRGGRLLLSPADASAELRAAEPGAALAGARRRPQLLRRGLPAGPDLRRRARAQDHRDRRVRGGGQLRLSSRRRQVRALPAAALLREARRAARARRRAPRRISPRTATSAASTPSRRARSRATCSSIAPASRRC